MDKALGVLYLFTGLFAILSMVSAFLTLWTFIPIIIFGTLLVGCAVAFIVLALVDEIRS